jgi:hypothetical protein
MEESIDFRLGFGIRGPLNRFHSSPLIALVRFFKKADVISDKMAASVWMCCHFFSPPLNPEARVPISEFR